MQYLPRDRERRKGGEPTEKKRDYGITIIQHYLQIRITDGLEYRKILAYRLPYAVLVPAAAVDHDAKFKALLMQVTIDRTVTVRFYFSLPKDMPPWPACVNIILIQFLGHAYTNNFFCV